MKTSRTRRIISLTLSVLITVASLSAVLSIPASAADTDPVTYVNNFEEDGLDTLISKYSMTNPAYELTELTDENNTVLCYNSTNTYGQTFNSVVYLPEKINPTDLGSYSWSYPFAAKVTSEKNYLHVKFRYKLVSFASDCIRARFYVSTCNAANASNNVNKGTLLCSTGTVGQWITVDKIVELDCANCNWQNNGLAIALYDTRANLYIDDIVVEDYTKTDKLFATLMNGSTNLGTAILSSNADLPQKTSDGKMIAGWYTDAALTTAFDYSKYDASAGKAVTLYANAINVSMYSNSYEESGLSPNKYGAFSVATLADGNKALEYQLNEGDPYYTVLNYCALYNNITMKNYISNGTKMGIYHVSFRYKVDSIADGSMISIGLGTVNQENIWGAGAQRSAVLCSGGVTDGWIQAEGNVAVDCTKAVWNQCALSVAVKGLGTAYIDDVQISCYADSDYSLINYYLGDKVISNEIAQLSKISPDTSYNWYTDSGCTVPVGALSDRTAGSADNIVVSLYAKEKIAGDVDGNGILTIDDMTMLRKYLLGVSVNIVNGDVNGDGSISIKDLVNLKKKF